MRWSSQSVKGSRARAKADCPPRWTSWGRSWGRTLVATWALLAGPASVAGAETEPVVVTSRGAADADAGASGGLRVVFLLARQRGDLGELVLALSDPASPSYGRHVPVREVAARYGASAATVARVDAYLATFGASGEVDVTGTFSTALLTREQAHAMFGPSPSFAPPVPAGLDGAVTLILGAFHDGVPLRLPREPARGRLDGTATTPWPPWNHGSGTPAPCPSANPLDCTNWFPNPGPLEAFRMFTPDQLRTAYGVERTGLTGRGRTAVVVEFGQYVATSDVAAYTGGFGLPPLDLRQVVMDGPLDAIEVGFEATLDVETIAGIAPGIEHLTLITAPARTTGEYATYWPIVYAAALDVRNTGGRLPDALSSSWSLACEPDLQAAPLIDATEAILQTAAAAGVTVAVAAGDQGSSGCTDRDPPFGDRVLAVEYPGSSPWVTSVGGTSLELDAWNRIVDVRVWNDWPLALDRALPHDGCDTPPCRPNPVWAGAGGRSIFFARPAWQQGDGVDLDGPRQVPDVALLADIYPGTAIYLHGGWGTGNGTSQATPLFAGMALLLNEANAARGQSRIGFASPLLYALARRAPGVLVDVVAGENVIGDQQARFSVDCCFAGTGYDLASGLGTPLLDRIATALATRVAITPSARLPVVRRERVAPTH